MGISSGKFNNGTYFVSKIVLIYCKKKIVVLIEKNLSKSRLKAENLKNF